MGEKSATNVLREVDKARTMPLGKFLHALGLPGIGPELASAMASALGDAQGLLTWLDHAHAQPGEDEFGAEHDEAGKPYAHNQALRRVLELDGVGEIVALQFRDGLQVRRTLVEDLIGLLTIEKEAVKSVAGPFVGMTFCVTGTLSVPRKDIQRASSTLVARSSAAFQPNSACSWPVKRRALNSRKPPTSALMSGRKTTLRRSSAMALRILNLRQARNPRPTEGSLR